MTGLWISAVATVVVAGLLGAVAITGFRNGDTSSDAIVTATLMPVRQPDETRLVVIATVRNRSAIPVIAGLSARRSLSAGTMTARVPWRTARRRYLASEQATVGIVPPGESATLMVPVPGRSVRLRLPIPLPARGRHYRLVAVIGQSGRRLRVLTVPVAAARVMERSVTDNGRRVP